MTELKNFVGGKYADTRDGRTSDVIDPSTGETYTQAPVSTAEDVDTALRTAADAFTTWRDTTPSERSLALLKLADAVEARAQEFAEVEGRNTGKPHRADHERGDAADGRPAPVLRRRGPGPRGQVRRAST